MPTEREVGKGSFEFWTVLYPRPDAQGLRDLRVGPVG